MTEQSKPQHGGPRDNAGRPRGARTTEESELVPRLVAARSDDTLLDLAAELDIPYVTFRLYNRKRIVPKSGPVRSRIEAAVRKAEKPKS